MSRLIRKIILKYFGGTKNFIVWTIAVVLTIYFIDTFILTQDRIEYMVLGKKNSDVVEMHQNSVTSKDQDVTAVSKEITTPKPKVFKCGLQEECIGDKYAFFVRSGDGQNSGPTICFEDHYVISPKRKNYRRGINVVIVNDKTHKVVDSRSFDTYISDSALVRFLKLGVDDDHLMLAASYDEMSFNLKEDARKWFHLFGSSLISKVKFRDSFAFIGQLGLSRGSAIETTKSKTQRSEWNKKTFAMATEVGGCVSIPMGKLSKVEIQKAQVEDKSSMKLGHEWANCGIREPCSASSFAAYLGTGKGNIEGPSICVNGKYVIAKNLNEGGRGFNVAVVDPVRKDVVRVGHFDTYQEDSSNLEIFLEMMKENEIVLAVVNDDGSRNLDVHAKKLFKQLGSTEIEKLQFRSHFLFVGQKGMTGSSPIEQIEFAGKGGQWPKPVERQMCISTSLKNHQNLQSSDLEKVKGNQIKPDPLTTKNEKREEFCGKYDGYGDFCDAQHINEPLSPAPLTDKSLENNPVYNIPIIVIPGMNHNAVRMQLETILMQPGINQNMVTVMYDKKFPESGALASLFGFKAEQLESSTKYTDQIAKALEKVWTVYPDKKHVMVLEEEVILAPDFLSFMAQCLSVLDQDDSLIGVSAWNENGYEGASSVSSLVYRVETFPGMAFLLKRSFYDAHMKSNMAACCGVRSWNGWFSGKLGGLEMLVPDVSRCYRRPYESLTDTVYLTELFNRKRVTNLETSVKLNGMDALTKKRYEEELVRLIGSAVALDTQHAQECLAGKALGFYIPDSSGKTYVIYYEQKMGDDYEVLKKLCKCFKLFSLPQHKPKGLHQGLVRFTYKGNNMLLIGSKSIYVKMKPPGVKTVSES